MSTLLGNKEKKRQIILENFNQPLKEVSLTELKKISQDLKIPFYTFTSLNAGCGDTIYLLVKKKNKLVELANFASQQQACCLTVAATNILCCWMENKSIELVKTEIKQMEKMVNGQVYQLNNCCSMEVFQDLSNSPHRIECVNLVLRGIKEILNE